VNIHCIVHDSVTISISYTFYNPTKCCLNDVKVIKVVKATKKHMP